MTLLIPIICSAIAYLLGKEKNRGTAGAVWGFLLGPLGILVTVLLRAKDSH